MLEPALEAKDYARPALDKQRLGQSTAMIGDIRVGDAEARSRDTLGRVYEYFPLAVCELPMARGAAIATPRVASSGPVHRRRAAEG